MSDITPLVDVQGLTKTFGGERALDNVTLTVLPGEVHGLLGENGSGKSTLIKTLSGYHEPDSGELTVRGERVALPLSPGQPHELGFEFVHQHLGLLPELTVTENLYLGEMATSRSWFHSWRQAERRAGEIFEEYDVDILPTALVGEIQPVQRALLAIVRALQTLRVDGRQHRANLLVLDEPTVFLPRHQVHILFDFVRSIAESGSSVLFVSHDLDEVMDITDRVTVLRDGIRAGTRETATASKRDLIKLIIGRDLGDAWHSDDVATVDSPVLLRARNVTTRSVTRLDFELHEGEVLGFAGLVGSGYEDVVYALYGSDEEASGEVDMDGVTIDLRHHSPVAAMEHRMALVPADRQEQGSIATLTAADNINVPVLDRFFSSGRLHHKQLRQNALDLMTEFDVRPLRPDMEYGSFSGGNQQKAMMAKWQQIEPRVLLLHEPTQGVDIGAREQIFDMIRSNRDVSAVICASSDYEQLAAICDRVAIIVRGKIVAFVAGAELTKERIADLCMGQEAGAE